MSLLKEATNEQAYIKAGLLGFAGSGKTYTTAMLALGIAKQLASGKPVAFFDTETGSDYVLKYFQSEGVKLLRLKAKSFNELLTVAKEAEKECSVLIVDSITHVWRDLCESYKKRKNRTKLYFQDWDEIKRVWNEWTMFYLNSNLHIFVLGRAGYEYDMEKDEDGKNELTKVGTKMKVESEFGFEPSLLIEMERVSNGAEPGAGWINRAHVLKDRSDTINGRAFDLKSTGKGYKEGDWYNTYKHFESFFKFLNIGGEHKGISEGDSQSRFAAKDGDGEYQKRLQRKDIALEEIKLSLSKVYGGKTDAVKAANATICEVVLGVRVWPAVEAKTLEELERAAKIFRAMEGQFDDVSPEKLEDVRRFATSFVEGFDLAQKPADTPAPVTEKTSGDQPNI